MKKETTTTRTFDFYLFRFCFLLIFTLFTPLKICFFRCCFDGVEYELVAYVFVCVCDFWKLRLLCTTVHTYINEPDVDDDVCYATKTSIHCYHRSYSLFSTQKHNIFLLKFAMQMHRKNVILVLERTMTQKEKNVCMYVYVFTVWPSSRIAYRYIVISSFPHDFA